MDVGQRIAELHKHEDSSLVEAVGCDCYGDITDVYILGILTNREEIRALTPKIGTVIIGTEGPDRS